MAATRSAHGQDGRPWNGDESSLDIEVGNSGGARHEEGVGVASGARRNERSRCCGACPMRALPLHLLDRLLRHTDQDIERVPSPRHAGVPVAMHGRQAQLRPAWQRLLPDHEPPRLSGAWRIARESVSGSAPLHIALPPREHRVLTGDSRDSGAPVQRQAHPHRRLAVAARDRRASAKLLIFKMAGATGLEPATFGVTGQLLF